MLSSAMRMLLQLMSGPINLLLIIQVFFLMLLKHTMNLSVIKKP